MNSEVIAVTVLAILITACLAAYLNHQRRRDCGDFDGGFQHDNDVRITRIRSSYIIHERLDQ
jgi:hypothetical protein